MLKPTSAHRKRLALLVCVMLPIAVSSMFVGCQSTGTLVRRQSLSEQGRKWSESFKARAGKNRTTAWERMIPALTNALAITPRTRVALDAFFLDWLGAPDPTALARNEGHTLFPGTTQKTQGNVLAWQLRQDGNLFEDLIVDFRDPPALKITTKITVEPEPDNGQHSRITAAERQVAAELDATEIKLSGGSEDGRKAKPGYCVTLEHDQINADNLRKARSLSTLVGLVLSGKVCTDATIAVFKDHPYLAQIELNDTGVTYEGLLQLRSIKALRSLRISSQSISKDSLAALKRRLPKCDVELESQ
jgi:hypothetical protein